MNSLYVLTLYNYEGTYVFDDPQVDLVREPFVMDMPEIIEHQMGGRPIGTFTEVFSAAAFPGYNTVLKRLDPEYGTTWYELDGTHLHGWLCPALFTYFEVAPETLYVAQTKIRPTTVPKQSADRLKAVTNVRLWNVCGVLVRSRVLVSVVL